MKFGNTRIRHTKRIKPISLFVCSGTEWIKGKGEKIQEMLTANLKTQVVGRVIDFFLAHFSMQDGKIYNVLCTTAVAVCCPLARSWIQGSGYSENWIESHSHCWLCFASLSTRCLNPSRFCEHELCGLRTFGSCCLRIAFEHHTTTYVPGI